jgi:hypothetical protein
MEWIYSVGGGRDHSGDAKPSDTTTGASLGRGAIAKTGRTEPKSAATNATTGSTETLDCWMLLQPNSLAAMVDR